MTLDTIIEFVSPINVVLKYKIEDVHFKSIDDLDFNQDSIGWCSDKNLDSLLNLKSGTVILSEKGRDFCAVNSLSNINLLIVSHPRKSFASILNCFIVKKESYSFVSPSAFICSSVHYNQLEVNIGHNVVIEEGVIIGQKVSIGSNTVIKAGTVLKNNIKIGSNCTIGGVGFGYEPNEEGEYELIPHIGNVLIEDNVEIGNNVCIDRAVLGSTKLSKNVKIDNLVHIAHGVHIGENSLIIANAMVAGSVTIGKNVWVAPSSSIKQKLILGDDSIIGMGSVVLKSVLQGDTVAGVPSKSIIKK